MELMCPHVNESGEFMNSDGSDDRGHSTVAAVPHGGEEGEHLCRAGIPGAWPPWRREIGCRPGVGFPLINLISASRFLCSVGTLTFAGFEL